MRGKGCVQTSNSLAWRFVGWSNAARPSSAAESHDSPRAMQHEIAASDTRHGQPRRKRQKIKRGVGVPGGAAAIASACPKNSSRSRKRGINVPQVAATNWNIATPVRGPPHNANTSSSHGNDKDENSSHVANTRTFSSTKWQTSELPANRLVTVKREGVITHVTKLPTRRPAVINISLAFRRVFWGIETPHCS